MSRDQINTYWRWGFGIAGVVVGLVVALLLAIIATARAIRANVGRVEAVAAEIVANTKAVWRVSDSDAAISRLLATARSIGQHAEAIADALEAPARPAG
jgi:hypothetical protein